MGGAPHVPHTPMDEVRRVYAQSGIGTRVGFGVRPALLVVDFQLGFTDPSYAVGADLTPAIDATRTLLAEARKARLPIAFTAVGFDRGQRDGAVWLKMPGLAVLIEGTRPCQIDPRLEPQPGEPVWIKRAASSFFGTPIIPFLTAARVDTLIVTGCVTSGCVRATAVDAVSFGYRTVVPLDCVADRAEMPHLHNLFDIDAKYADVESLSQVLAVVKEVKEFTFV